MTSGFAALRERVGTQRLVALGILLTCVVVYANSWTNDFVLDDRGIIRDNPSIKGLHKIPALFQQDYWYPELISGLYRPLVNTTYALNFAVGGLDTRGYHVVNIALHGLVSILVWVMARRVFGDPWIAGGAGFLFAAHAIHTEAVANIVGRAEILAALFFLLVFLSYLKSGEVQGGRRAFIYGGSLLALLAGLLCKETAATSLGAIGLYDVVYTRPRGESMWRRITGAVAENWRRYAGYIAVVGVYIGIRIWALGWRQTLPPLPHMDNPIGILDPHWRILSALKVGLIYLWKQIFPLTLSYDYSYNAIPSITSLADPMAWAVLAAWAAIIGLVIWSYRAWPDLFFSLGLYLITFALVSNVFVVIGTIMGERLVYLPSMAFCFVAVLLLQRVLERLGEPRARRAFSAAVALLVVLHGARAMVRNLDWSTKDRLFLVDWETQPESSKTTNNAASTLFGMGEYEKALVLFHKAIEIEPHYWMPYRTAGFSYTALGEDLKAMEMYDLAMRYGAEDAKLLNNLGFIMVDHGIEVDRGVGLLERAVEKRPKNYDFLDSLGWGYYRQGRLEEARDTLRRSLELNGTSPSAPSRRQHLAEIEEAILEKRARERVRSDLGID